MAPYPGYGPITPAQQQNIINQSTAVVKTPSHREANEARIREARAGNATAAREIAQLRGDSRFNAGLENYKPKQTRPSPPRTSSMRNIYSRKFSPKHPDLHGEGHRLRYKMENSANLSDREFAQVVGSYQNLSNAMYQGAMGQAAKVYGGPQGRGPLGPGREGAKAMYGQHAKRYSKEMGERKGYIQAAKEKRELAAVSRRAKRMKDQADALAQRQAASQRTAQQAAQQRQNRAAQQGRQIANLVNRSGTSASPSQSYYRPPSRGVAPGASMFQQAMMRGFRPPEQNNRRQFSRYGYGAMQTRPQRGGPSNMPAHKRRKRASDVNAPAYSMGARQFHNRSRRS